MTYYNINFGSPILQKLRNYFFLKSLLCYKIKMDDQNLSCNMSNSIGEKNFQLLSCVRRVLSQILVHNNTSNFLNSSLFFCFFFLGYQGVFFRSRGRDCGLAGSPGIYSRVQAFLPWIESLTMASPGFSCTPPNTDFHDVNNPDCVFHPNCRLA